MSAEFDYANLLLGKNTFHDTTKGREKYFNEVLNTFKLKNIQPHIFQVGCIETFHQAWKDGSGWSDITFGKYTQRHGGSLTICDIDLDHIANSSYAASRLGYQVNLLYGDAINFISNSYNLFYLDGGNDPAETLNQYNNILDLNKVSPFVVVVDDFSIKGTLLQNHGFVIHDVANGLGIKYFNF